MMPPAKDRRRSRTAPSSRPRERPSEAWFNSEEDEYMDAEEGTSLSAPAVLFKRLSIDLASPRGLVPAPSALPRAGTSEDTKPGSGSTRRLPFPPSPSPPLPSRRTNRKSKGRSSARSATMINDDEYDLDDETFARDYESRLGVYNPPSYLGGGSGVPYVEPDPVGDESEDDDEDDGQGELAQESAQSSSTSQLVLPQPSRPAVAPPPTSAVPTQASGPSKTIAGGQPRPTRPLPSKPNRTPSIFIPKPTAKPPAPAMKRTVSAPVPVACSSSASAIDPTLLGRQPASQPLARAVTTGSASPPTRDLFLPAASAPPLPLETSPAVSQWVPVQVAASPAPSESSGSVPLADIPVSVVPFGTTKNGTAKRARPEKAAKPPKVRKPPRDRDAGPDDMARTVTETRNILEVEFKNPVDCLAIGSNVEEVQQQLQERWKVPAALFAFNPEQLADIPRKRLAGKGRLGVGKPWNLFAWEMFPGDGKIVWEWGTREGRPVMRYYDAIGMCGKETYSPRPDASPRASPEAQKAVPTAAALARSKIQVFLTVKRVKPKKRRWECENEQLEAKRQRPDHATTHGPSGHNAQGTSHGPIPDAVDYASDLPVPGYAPAPDGADGTDRPYNDFFDPQLVGSLLPSTQASTSTSADVVASTLGSVEASAPVAGPSTVQPSAPALPSFASAFPEFDLSAGSTSNVPSMEDWRLPDPFAFEASAMPAVDRLPPVAEVQAPSPARDGPRRCHALPHNSYPPAAPAASTSCGGAATYQYEVPPSTALPPLNYAMPPAPDPMACSDDHHDAASTTGSGWENLDQIEGFVNNPTQSYEHYRTTQVAGQSHSHTVAPEAVRQRSSTVAESTSSSSSSRPYAGPSGTTAVGWRGEGYNPYAGCEEFDLPPCPVPNVKRESW